MNKKILYPLAIICCLSLLSFAGSNKKNCITTRCSQVEKACPAKASQAAEREIDVLSPLHFFVFSI